MNAKYLGVAVAVTGRVFAHPADGSEEAARAHRAAKERGDYPYAHLYEGDNVCTTVSEMREEGCEY